MYWRAPRQSRLARRLLAVAARCALWPRAQAAAVSLVPPKPDVFLGVSDRGTTTEFNEFAELTGKHPALLQTFHPWGNSLNEAYERWRETGDPADPRDLDRRRPDPGGADHPAADRPRRRRRLPAAAQRLLRQPRAARLHPPAGRAEPLPQRLVGGQLRRQPERRRTHRPAGTSRPSAGSPRSSAAGRRLEGINATLAEIGLPPLNRTKGPNPESLPAAPVSIVWSPLPGGSPRVRATSPATTGPAAAGSTGSAPTSTPSIPSGKTSTASTPASSGRASRSRSPSGRSPAIDEPRFVKQLIAWTVKRPRVRMLVYYQGFGPGNPYDLRLYPRTTNTLRLKIRRPNFLETADYNASLFPPLPPKPRKK